MNYYAIALCLITGCTAAIGIAFATAKAVESIARQPEAGARILSITVLGTSLIEATAIYGFVIALLMLVMK